MTNAVKVSSNRSSGAAMVVCERLTSTESAVRIARGPDEWIQQAQCSCHRSRAGNGQSDRWSAIWPSDTHENAVVQYNDDDSDVAADHGFDFRPATCTNATIGTLALQASARGGASKVRSRNELGTS